MHYTIKTSQQLSLYLQGFRKENQLTQKALAETLGISQQSYQVLESKPQSVTFERLLKVLNVLNVEIKLSSTPQNNQLPLVDASWE